MNWEIVGQAFGILGAILTVLTYQMNTSRSLLATLSGATVCASLGYLCLGAWSGFALNVVALLRNLCFGVQTPGTRFSRISTGIFTVGMCVAGAFSWQGPISLLIIIALALNTVFMSFGDPQRLRKSILLTSSMVFVYNIVVFTVGGMLNELIAIVSSIIGIWRFRKRPKQTK